MAASQKVWGVPMNDQFMMIYLVSAYIILVSLSWYCWFEINDQEISGGDFPNVERVALIFAILSIFHPMFVLVNVFLLGVKYVALAVN